MKQQNNTDKNVTDNDWRKKRLHASYYVYFVSCKMLRIDEEILEGKG